MIVAIRSGVRAQATDIGNSAQRTAPTMSMYKTRSISHKRYALASDVHIFRSGFWKVLTTEPAAVPVVNTFCVVGTGLDGVGFGAAAANGFAGAADTVAGAAGALTTGVCGIVARPDVTFVETTVKHTGLPERAESKVTVSGRVPAIGVVWISTRMRSMPEASVLRVIKLNGINVSPTEPIRATYEGSETVNSKEWRAPS